MANTPIYLLNGDVRRIHSSKDRAASKGASLKEQEKRRLAKRLRRIKKK